MKYKNINFQNEISAEDYSTILIFEKIKFENLSIIKFDDKICLFI